MSTAAAATPVLVGVGTAVHRPEAGPTPEPIDLMGAAVVDAGRDSSEHFGQRLLADVSWIGVPKGTWDHPDAGRALAAGVGVDKVHSVLAEVGILQQTVIASAVQAVTDGARAALVVGGEAAHGSVHGAAGSVAESLLGDPPTPDERWTTDDYGLSHQELARMFVNPPTVYAVMESALAHAAGRSPVEQRQYLGRLQARLSTAAETNEDAWSREPLTAETIATASSENRLVAEPYTKLCCSNLRVNQAAALLFTTAGHARSLGIAEDRWVFPHSSTESNLCVPVVQRPELHRSPAAAVAGRRALELAETSAEGVDHVDLYSCFPAAVQVHAAELGIDLDRQLTVTGGMTFAGGPLNSYVLQSTAAMARVLRDDPGSYGLVTSVSGMITKPGFGVWSTTPPAERFGFEDVTDEVRSTDERRAEVEEVTGPVTVVAHTVEHDRHGAVRVLAIAETPDERRILVESADDDLIAQFSAEDHIGRTHQVAGNLLQGA